jgi:hypothetical protein
VDAIGGKKMSETVRLDRATYAALREMTRSHGLSLTETLSRAIEALRRKLFLEGVNHDFAALRADASVWKEERAELGNWDANLGDGAE